MAVVGDPNILVSLPGPERGVDVVLVRLSSAGLAGCGVWDTIPAKSPVLEGPDRRPKGIRAKHVAVVVFGVECVRDDGGHVA